MLGLFRNLMIVSILPATLGAQTLEQRIGATGSGTVRMSFAAHPGVCGGAPSTRGRLRV